MATVTTTQIKTALDADLAAANITISTYDFPRPVKRRIFPSIEIKATQPEGNEIDIRITKIIQRFDVTIRVKQRGAGTDDIEFLKSVENTVLASLDLSTLGKTTLFVLNKNFNRQGELVEKPVPHLMSSLIVLTEDITSTSGDGKIGAQITLTLPGPIVIPLLSKPIENYGISSDEDLDDDGLAFETGMAHTSFGEIACEYESTTALAAPVKALVDAKAKISITITKDGDAEAHNVLLLRTSKPAQYDDIERATLTMNLTS